MKIKEKNKKKGNIITSIYSRGLINRNIVLPITNIGKNIKETLEQRIADAGLQDSFGAILVPTEEVVEMKKGGKKQRSCARVLLRFLF